VATEIERKFLVKGDGWRDVGEATTFRQGYLSTDKNRTVRVRVAGQQGTITIKGITVGAQRSEFEYPIPLTDASAMLDELCVRPLIEKTRHVVDVEGSTWEVDEFAGVNRGLIVAEVEIGDVDQEIVLPEWIGAEVTDDPRYFNANLIAHPFSEW
jgi:adenylate cyclase